MRLSCREYFNRQSHLHIRNSNTLSLVVVTGTSDSLSPVRYGATSRRHKERSDRKKSSRARSRHETKFRPHHTGNTNSFSFFSYKNQQSRHGVELFLCSLRSGLEVLVMEDVKAPGYRYIYALLVKYNVLGNRSDSRYTIASCTPKRSHNYLVVSFCDLNGFYDFIDHNTNQRSHVTRREIQFLTFWFTFPRRTQELMSHVFSFQAAYFA